MHRVHGLVDVGRDHRLVVVARDLQRQIDRFALVLEQIFLVDTHEGGVAERDLRRFRRAGQTCHGDAVHARVRALLLQIPDQVIQDLAVEVVAAELVVAVARQDLGDLLGEAHDRHVEGAASQVVDQNGLGLVMIDLVGECGGRRLVDDAHDLEPGELAGVACRLALRIREVGRDRDDRLGHRLAQIGLGGALEPSENERRDLLRAVALRTHLDEGVLAHAPFDRADGALRGQDVLVARALTDQEGAVVRDPDHGGQDGAAVDRDESDTTLLDHRDLGVGGAEIDADDDVAHWGWSSNLLTMTSARRRSDSPRR